MLKYGLLILFTLNIAVAQDEREFRRLFSIKKKPVVEVEFPNIQVSSPKYEYDLDGDKQKEQIKILRKDGVSFLNIFDHSGKLLREVGFQSKGLASNLYKLRSSYIKDNILTIILYFDEGYTQSTRFQNTARVYFLTVENKDWKNSKLVRGPSFFIEKELARGRYFRRGYQVNFLDSNLDGTKEIVVSYGHIQRIFLYRKNEWQEFL